LLAGLLCLPSVARADAEAELRAAFYQGRALQQKADYAGAVKAYQRALELAPQVLGPDHVNTAGILNNLAAVYADMGQPDKAEPLYQQSLKIYESKVGPDHPVVATSLNNLGNLYKGRGQYTKAEPLYQRSLRIRELKLGPDHPDVAQSLNNLAVLYDDLGQYAQAEPLLQRSLKIYELKLGPDDPTVADTLNNLAILYQNMGQIGRMEPLYQRSLKIRESKLGLDHPQVAASLNNLALLYKDLGRYAQAEPLYQRSLKIMESRLGPDHPNVAAALNNLASLYQDIGQYAQAEQLFQRSLKIKESNFGPEHPAVADGLNNLALLYQNRNQYAQAEPLFQRSLTIRQSKLGPNHPDVAASLNNLAVLYWHMGRYAQAEPLYQQSLKIRQSHFGAEHPSVATSLNNLAILYMEMGQYAQAEPRYQRSLKIMESQFGPAHPNVAANLSNLALLHAATGRWSEAVAETDRARQIVRSQVARVLPALSEKEQLTFLLTQNEEQLHVAWSLALHQRGDAQAAQHSAGWVLNGKAVAQEVLAQRALLAGETADPALADVIKQLLAVRRRLASLSLSIPQAGQETEYQRQLQTLNQQEQELSRQLGQASGRTAGGDSWVEPDAVRKVLPKDAVLIEIARHAVYNFQAKGKEYHWLVPHYTAWLIPAEGQGQVSVVDLGEALKIDDAVQKARSALEKAGEVLDAESEAAAEQQLRNVMQILTRLVLEPLEEHLGQTRQLIVSPDAALWLIPWGALPLADGRYALEKYQIRYCVSGRELLERKSGAARAAGAPTLFANPDYNLGPGEASTLTRSVLRSVTPVGETIDNAVLGNLSSIPQVARLPGTAQEAAAVQPNMSRYAGAETVVYEDQTALEGVFKALHHPRVLMLATHGFFLPDQDVARDERTGDSGVEYGQSRTALTAEGKPLENPLLRCGLLLAGCNRRTEVATALDDGILTGLEIVGTDLRGTELVVLSACDTGLGQVRNGEGVAGLRQAFQLAGAEAVIATLWQIPDEETVALMTALFANLSAGQSKAGALRNAQLAQIKARRAAHRSAAHPYYWAAFTLTGE
jgi:CHAT domain-containing protein